MRPGAQAAVPLATAVAQAEPPSSVVAMPARERAVWLCHPKEILERVYAAGSLPVGADDLAAKCAVVALAAFGFLVVDEIQVNGTARRLGDGEARRDSTARRPWRVSKPAFAGGAIGVPDAGGVVAPREAGRVKGGCTKRGRSGSPWCPSPQNRMALASTRNASRKGPA